MWIVNYLKWNKLSWVNNLLLQVILVHVYALIIDYYMNNILSVSISIKTLILLKIIYYISEWILFELIVWLCLMYYI